jgi:hypothetical protein
VVERILGKAEVDSSILSGGTSEALAQSIDWQVVSLKSMPANRPKVGVTACATIQ